MADSRIIELRLKPTFNQMSTAGSSIVLSDTLVAWDFDLEKPTNNAIGKLSNFVSSATNNTAAITTLPDGRTRVTMYVDYTATVINGFTLRSAWYGSPGSSVGAAYVNDFDGSVELFDNESVIIRVMWESIVAKSDVVYSDIVYNNAGDKVRAAIIPWARERVGSNGRSLANDGTLTSGSTGGIKGMTLEEAVDWFFLNGNIFNSNTAISVTTNMVIRKTETMTEPVRETDIVLSSVADTGRDRMLRYLGVGRYGIILEREVPVLKGQTIQLVIKEKVNCRQRGA